MPVLWSLRKTLFICFLLSNTSSVTLKHSIVIYTKYLFQHLVNFWKILTALTKGQTENISKTGSTCHILKFPLMHATFIKLKIVKRRKLNELNCSGNCGHVSGGTVENFSLGVNPIWMVFTDRERNSVGGKKIQEKEKLCFESSQTFYNKFNLIFKGKSCISINSQNSIQHISLVRLFCFLSPSSLLTLPPLLPLVRLMTISLKINCESEVGQRLPTHHLSSTSVPAPNEFISFFDNEVIFIHPCCKYHQRRFKTVPSECQFATYWLPLYTNSILWKKNLDNTWLARFGGRRLPLLTVQGKEACFLWAWSRVSIPDLKQTTAQLSSIQLIFVEQHHSVLSLLSSYVMCRQALPSPPDANIHHTHSHPCPHHPKSS